MTFSIKDLLRGPDAETALGFFMSAIGLAALLVLTALAVAWVVVW